MKVLRSWVQLPSPWVATGGLRRLKWTPGKGADNTAALMVFIAIAHHIDMDTEVSRITYDKLCSSTGLSRPKVAAGLKVLKQENLIEANVDGRGTYRLIGQKEGDKWGKLPARGMYSGQVITAFRDFTLRNQSELNAMKLLILFVARRSNKDNLVRLSFDKIEEYTDMPRNKIRSALTLLISIGLVHLDRVVDDSASGSMFNAYRLAHIDSFNHAAVKPRST